MTTEADGIGKDYRGLHVFRPHMGTALRCFEERRAFVVPGTPASWSRMDTVTMGVVTMGVVTMDTAADGQQ
ncbi:hypothetical protein [Streptomyces sp. NPDC051776]|uniref:hypothetical protein n=1 Tax=Streptomyces sp. NPDC051776 TaxID=3155414 RepID=UPI00343C686B